MDRSTSGERILSTCFLMLMVFGVCLRPVPSYALRPESSSESSSLPELGEKINSESSSLPEKSSSLPEPHGKVNMEEMKIHGDVHKPNIMYIIPRANLHSDPVMYDGYFLPLSPDSPGDKNPARRSPAAAHRETTLPVPAGYHLKADSPEVKKGSCIFCHYPGLIMPEGHHAPSLIKELNQLCLQCHSARFYYLNREVIEEMNTSLKGEELSSSSELSPPREISLNNTLCRKCHVTWTPKAEVYTQQAESLSPPKEFDPDKFCKVCHRSRVY